MSTETPGPSTTQPQPHNPYHQQLLLAPPGAAGTPNIPFFPKLAIALEHAEEVGETRLWSCDISSYSGAKSFGVGGFEDFWEYYASLNPIHRCFYEIVPENTMCNLFIDIDVDLKLNPNVDGPTTINTFINELCTSFAEIYDPTKLKYRLERDDFVILESSNASKLSYHLVGHARGTNENGEEVSCAWSSYSAVSAFLQLFLYRCNLLDEEIRDRIICKRVSRGQERIDCVMDSLIYTPFRSFRVFMSAKRSESVKKMRFLKKSPLDTFNYGLDLGAGGDGDIDMDHMRRIFMSSLITRLPDDVMLLEDLEI